MVYYLKLDGGKAMRFDNLLLARLRIENKLTQMELSKKVNHSRPTVAGWELGTIIPDLAQIDEIGKVFGVPPKLFIIDDLKGD
jgi:transcriptional regulator with XRE-family HTH domain